MGTSKDAYINLTSSPRLSHHTGTLHSLDYLQKIQGAFRVLSIANVDPEEGKTSAFVTSIFINKISHLVALLHRVRYSAPCPKY